jgi:hypothetical protein
MDKDEFLGERRHVLEEAFFKKQEQESLAKLRSELGRKSSRAELATASGIEDPLVLDRLVDLGVTAAALTAIALAPLLQVAWADGEIQPAERTAILDSARKRGISENSPAFALLSDWLGRPPEPLLGEAWATYTRALCEKMSAEQRAALKQQVVSFARGVAEAAGGFLGLHTISAAEEQALAAIGRAFDSEP